MASTSGYFTWTSSNQYVDAHISWSLSSQNVAGNYSTISWNLSFSRTNTGYTTTRYWYGSVNVAGNTYTHNNGDESNYVDIVYGSNAVVMSGTTNIYHNADGTQSFYIGTLGTSYLRKKTASADITVGEYQQAYTLPTIARASSVSATSANVGGKSTITVSRASSSFTHTLVYGIGSTTIGTIATNVATSYSWTVPASLTTYMTNAKSATVNVYCHTYNGSTLIGTTVCQMTATIPVSTITSAPTTNLGSTMAISISRINTSDTNLTHTLTVTFGGYSGTMVSKSTLATVNWSVPTSLGGQIPSTMSGSGTLTLTTYHGSATVGTSTKTFTLNVPSYTPTIGALSASITGDSVSQGWGIYVQGKSKCALSLGACSTSYGATISSYSITGEGISVSKQSGTTSVLSKTGTITYTAKVTDSRGKTNSTTKNISVTAYSSPTFTSCLSQRCTSGGTLADDGTYVSSKVGFTYSAIGSNSVTTSIAYKTGSGSYTSAGKSFTSGNVAVWGDDNISADASYSVRYSVKDAYTTVNYYDNVSTAEFLMDVWQEGKSLAVGKSAENTSSFEIAPSMTMRCGSVVIGDTSQRNKTINFYDAQPHNIWMGFANTTGQFYLYDKTLSKSIIRQKPSGQTSMWLYNDSAQECLQFWGDGEGGNIRITAPSTYGNYWDIDAYNSNLRFYTYNADKAFKSITFDRASGGITCAGSISSSGGLTASGGNIWAGATSATAERDVGVYGGAGRIYLYSGGSSTANRGLYTYNSSNTGVGVITVSSANGISFNGTASYASKLGSATVGSANQPIYLNAGTPTAVKCRMYCWTVVATVSQQTSCSMATTSSLNTTFGVSNCGQTNTIVLFANGDGAANSSHIDGGTFQSNTWWAVFDRSTSGSIRINACAIYFG